MRVTQRHLIEQASRNIVEHQEKLQRLQTEVASGKRIQRPEDDPLGAERALGIRSRLRALEATRRNLDLSRDWLSATEAALKSLNQVSERAHAIALRSANDLQSPESYEAFAAEVDQLLDQAIQISNTSHRGVYLFSGRKTITAPFERVSTPASTVIYRGDDGVIEHQIEEGSRIQVNVPGSHPLFQQIFESLAVLRDRLRANDGAALRSSMEELDQAMDATLGALAEVGTRVGRVDATASRLETLEVDLRSLLSRIEDADMAEAILNLNMEEQSYRAVLAASARLLGSSLFDYLR